MFNITNQNPISYMGYYTIYTNMILQVFARSKSFGENMIEILF